MFKLNGQKLLPMNAYQMGKNRSHIVFPAYYQPKLDGNRCLAFRNGGDGGKPILISRNGKLIAHLDAQRGEISRLLDAWNGDRRKQKKGGNLYLDGELYIDDSNELGDLRRVLGRKKENNVNKNLEKRIKFYLFDCFVSTDMKMGFKERWEMLVKVWKKENRKRVFKYLKLVPTVSISNEEDVETVFNKMLDKGYEGVVLRNIEGDGYLLGGKRSKDIITSKNFKRGQFEICGVKEGLGKDKGTAVFKLKCLNSDGHFWSRPMGTMEERKKMFTMGSEMIGTLVDVKYIEMDKSSGCVTRNPVIFT